MKDLYWTSSQAGERGDTLAQTTVQIQWKNMFVDGKEVKNMNNISEIFLKTQIISPFWLLCGKRTFLQVNWYAFKK